MGRQAVLTGRGVNQGALAAVLVALVNRVHSQCVPAVNSGSAATFKTTVVPSGGIVFEINGVRYLKADLSAQVITGFNIPTTAAGQWLHLRVQLDKDGTVSILFSGPFATLAEAKENPPTRSVATATICSIILPPSFVPGTTALDVTNVTYIDGDPDLRAIDIPA
jgi:hypothetical protein